MPRPKDGLSFKHLFTSFSAVVFHHTVVFLLLTVHCAGQYQVIGPPQPIVATVGEDIILPCNLRPVVDASDMTIEWARHDLIPRFVFVWRDGVELESKKHPSYRGRTSVFSDKLKQGDISLKLSKVKVSDEGTYRCFIPTLGEESTVELVVGVVSFIVISLVRTEEGKASSGLVLQCESAGWYPKPEVFWLDSEGNLLSAGPTETVRGPDGLYTVSSRLTVEKRKSNRFTCRVQQKNIDQTRETHIHVPDDTFMVCCRPESHITIFLAVGFLFLLAVFFIVWKWRQNKMKEQEDDEYVITTLMDHQKELENLRNILKLQQEEVERERTENKKKLEPTNISSRFVYGEEITLRDNIQKLDKRKIGLEECLKKAEEQLKTSEDVISRMTAGKTQLKETKRQRDDSKKKKTQSQRSERENGNENTESLKLTEDQ